MESLRAPPQEAARVEAAHRIFRERFCLERLLTVVGDRHRDAVGRARAGRAAGQSIQVIVCPDRRPPEDVWRVLDGVAAQSGAAVEGVLLAQRAGDTAAAAALAGYSGPAV